MKKVVITKGKYNINLGDIFVVFDKFSDIQNILLCGMDLCNIEYEKICEYEGFFLSGKIVIGVYGDSSDCIVLRDNKEIKILLEEIKKGNLVKEEKEILIKKLTMELEKTPLETFLELYDIKDKFIECVEKYPLKKFKRKTDNILTDIYNAFTYGSISQTFSWVEAKNFIYWEEIHENFIKFLQK